MENGPKDEKTKPEENKNELQTELLKKVLKQIQSQVKTALELLDDRSGAAAKTALLAATPQNAAGSPEGRTIEGVFDGQRMVGDDGATYTIPQNYASKSKLVSGDRLKLIITSSGNFIFKQIGPIERERVVGNLALDPATNQYVVRNAEKEWKVLTASVTYFRCEPGEEVVILVPKGKISSWAAVDNVVRKQID